MAHSFEIIAGRLCLDFVNTVSIRPCGPASCDYLHDYAQLLAWSRAAGTLTVRGTRTLSALAASQPARARRVLQQARSLRERLYRLFRARSAGHAPPADDLARFSTALAAALTQRRLHYRAGKLAYDWPGACTRLDSVLWPVLLSAESVLCSDDPARLGTCTPPEGCGWLYYDTSKNRSRRWCSMRSCGNAVKARRHYARRRAQHSR